MEIEEKSPAAVPEEGKILNTEGANEDLSTEEAWVSSVKDSKWASAEPIADSNPYRRSNGSSSQSKWASPEGNRYRSQYNENNFGGYGNIDRNRKEHSNYPRQPYNNRQGVAGSRDGSTEQHRPGNGYSNHSYGTRNFNNMDSNRFTGSASMRSDSNTNQNYHNRPYNNTFRESDNSSRYNNRYDNHSHTPRSYENTNNRNDRSFGHQNYQHDRNDRQHNRQNYRSDRNSHYSGRQSNDSAIDRWHTDNLVEEDTGSSAQDRPWNMRFVTGNKGTDIISDEGNDQNNAHEEKNVTEDKAESEVASGNPESIQEPENSKENDENALYKSHSTNVMQSDAVNIQLATSSQESTAADVGQTINEHSSVESMHKPQTVALHDSSKSDMSQVDEVGITSTESVRADSTLPSHSIPSKQAENHGEPVADWKQYTNERAMALGSSSDSIHAPPERRQQKPTERKSSGAGASAGKPSIVDRLAAGGYHKPTVDEDALNAKIERIRLQNEKLERKQKLIEEEEMEIARQLKLENEKREQERLESDKLEREHRLAEEKKQRERHEKEQRILNQIKAEREANASRKAEAMGNRDWDMSKGENGDGFRDRHSRSKFSNNIGQRWPSPPARSRNERTFDQGSGHHSQGYHRYGAENARQEPVKKQFSVKEEDWPDLDNSKGELGSVERKPAIWAARSALEAKEKEHSQDTDKSSSSPLSNSQNTGDSRKLVSWASKKAQDPTETTSPKHDENAAKPVPKLNWEDLITKTTPVKDWASDSPTNDDMDFGSSPFG